jgi:hypothetical protein
MCLGVDEDRRAGRGAIGDALSGDAVDILLGRWKTVRLAMPEGARCGAAREAQQPAARHRIFPRLTNHRLVIT